MIKIALRLNQDTNIVYACAKNYITVTKDLKSYTSQADILVTATGVPKFIKNDHVKNNAFVIDVGIIPTKDGICGDVDFESVKEVASKITPVPGGVGPVTVACSLKNIIVTYKNCVEEN